jgi:hypothetical protein
MTDDDQNPQRNSTGHMLIINNRDRRFRPSLMTLLLILPLSAALLGHLGSSTWYWILLPAVALAFSAYVDFKTSRQPA